MHHFVNPVIYKNPIFPIFVDLIRLFRNFLLWGSVESRFRPQIQAPHGCEPFGAPKDIQNWIDRVARLRYENQLGAKDNTTRTYYILHAVHYTLPYTTLCAILCSAHYLHLCFLCVFDPFDYIA